MKSYKDISELTHKAQITGSERIPLSASEYATTGDIAQLCSYDDAQIHEHITALQSQLNTLVDGNADGVINAFREIEAFLAGVTDRDTLTGLLAELRQQIEARIPKTLTPVAVATTVLTPSGGMAYYYSGSASLMVGSVGLFSSIADSAVLTVRGNTTVTFGAVFKLSEGLTTLTGTASQYKTYTIFRVPVGVDTYLYEVNGAIYG